MPGLSQNISDAIARLIVREGGEKVTDDELDRGGLTKFGISKAAHPNVDIRALTYADAVDLYFQNYYDAPGLDALPLAYAEPLMDLGVHAGPTQAIVLAQRAVKVPEDGVLGPRTRAAILAHDVAAFRKLFASERIGFYLHLILKRPSQVKYARGWIRRALELL